MDIRANDIALDRLHFRAARWMLAAIFGLLFLQATAVLGAAQESDPLSYWDLIAKDLSEIEGFVDFAARTDVSDVAVANRAELVMNRLVESQALYPSFAAPSEGRQITDDIAAFRGALQNYRAYLLSPSAAISDAPVDAINSALTDLDQSIANARTASQREVAQAIATDNQIRILLALGVVVALMISGSLLMKANSQSNDEVGRARAFAYRAMLRSSLFLLGGVLITLVTHVVAPGGSYLIAWGPMAFGLFALGSRVVTYARQVKPQLDAAARVDQSWIRQTEAIEPEAALITPFPKA